MTPRHLETLLVAPALVCLVAAADVAAHQQEPDGTPPDAYERGLALREEGDWSLALDVWEAEWEALTFSDERDPRLGIAYIETATEERAESRYETANEMYLWGLSNPDTCSSR